jgi:hypothetical protein
MMRKIAGWEGRFTPAQDSSPLDEDLKLKQKSGVNLYRGLKRK